ncbi:MAG: cobalamin biosynthesis protein CobW [Alphaproteobacteria bacterium]|nr:cobalamin biosynthesis protein CobW [Alphaproteobacteria bacterium]
MSLHRIPATVITGFLGAGKTTLIRNLLQMVDGDRLALIINEFGDIGVDAALAKECGAPSCDADSIIELANGCICCTVADDFLPSMEALLNQSPPPDRIIIETSGLALPQPLVQAFQWPDIRTRAMLDGVITVVDGAALATDQVASDLAAVEMQRQNDPELDHETPINELFHDQLSAANILVLSKTDLLSDADKQNVKAKLSRMMTQHTPIVETSAEAAPIAALFGLGLETEAFARSTHSLHDHHHHHDDDHHHDHGHDAFQTVVLSVPALTEPAQIVDAISELAEQGGMLRAKGFLSVHGKRAPLVVQAVGSRVEHYYSQNSAAMPDQDASDHGRLVIIGQVGMDVDALVNRIGGSITT